jgi:hypothetical protein
LIGILLINAIWIGLEFNFKEDLPEALELRRLLVTLLVPIGLAVNRRSSRVPLQALTSAAPIFALMVVTGVIGQVIPEP